jgi:Zn-dependent M28 family amino/carboxypeptidase
VRKGNDIDSIYNGADDNAAGTCTLLGIARNIKNSGLRPGRSIIFASFSGEESGMRGSRYFVANPPVPLKNIYANINFEMTGHSEFLGKNNYYMTGCGISQLDDLILKYTAGTECRLIDTIKVAEQLFSSSDNIAFSRALSVAGKNSGIPSGTFATTAHADYIHSPADESKYFDFENMATLVNHFTGMIIYLSNSREEISFTSTNYERIK